MHFNSARSCVDKWGIIVLAQQQDQSLHSSERCSSHSSGERPKVAVMASLVFERTCLETASMFRPDAIQTRCTGRSSLGKMSALVVCSDALQDCCRDLEKTECSTPLFQSRYCVDLHASTVHSTNRSVLTWLAQHLTGHRGIWHWCSSYGLHTNSRDPVCRLHLSSL